MMIAEDFKIKVFVNLVSNMTLFDLKQHHSLSPSTRVSYKFLPIFRRNRGGQCGASLLN